MWGLLGKAAMGLMKFPFKNKLLTAVGAGAVYWNKDALAEKKDQLVDQYNEQGLAETVNSLKNDIAESTTSLVSSAGDSLDTAKEVVNDPTGFADRKMGEMFDRVMNPDGDGDPNNPANHNESGSIFSAVGKLLKGDFSGAASAFSGDDGFGWGDGAKLGVVGAILMGIFKLFTGDKDENDNDGGFDLINGTTITIGLAALAFFNRGFIMEKVNDFTGGDQDNTFDNSAFEIG